MLHSISDDKKIRTTSISPCFNPPQRTLKSLVVEVDTFIWILAKRICHLDLSVPQYRAK